MALFDLPLPDLRAYNPPPPAPADLTTFWERTFETAAANPVAPTYTPTDTSLRNVDVHDVSFAGWGGAQISAWLLTPRDDQPTKPCVIQYLGYGMGRGLPHEHTMFPAAGWATLVVDTRGVSGPLRPAR